MAPGATQPKTTTGVKQDRPQTYQLQDLWLLKMGWKKDSAEGLWKEAARKADIPEDKATLLPGTKAGDAKCDVDHILELQFGGITSP
jgi:hypothetical protein